MKAPKWLHEYYGNSFSSLNPEVVLEGDRFAIVRLFRRTSSRGYSAVGYVLIKKNGKHSSSLYKSLHEGMADKNDLERMKLELEKMESGDTK